jgi:phosphoribosylformylglycinamidine synthase
VNVRVGIVTFPGSLDDGDAARAAALCGCTPVPLWHATDDVRAVDAVILPGGFSYGDYLRAGAIARFAPVMKEIITLAGKGLPVLGICNGFQILCEARLLPGALIRNKNRHFICRQQRLKVVSPDTVWTNRYQAGNEVELVLKSGEGNYVADHDTLHRLETEQQIVFRYMDNPNGSAGDIAGVTNERGNVVGLMPHPEHNVDPAVAETLDGRGFFESIKAFCANPPRSELS